MTSASPPAVRRTLLLSLLKRYYWFEESISDYVISRGWPDFTRSESMLMSNIVMGYTRPSDIARQLGISRQAAHKAIRIMEEKGIVKMSPDPDDSRINKVVLTEMGDQMRQDSLAAMEIAFAELCSRLGEETVVAVQQTLDADWGPPLEFGGVRSEGSRKSSPFYSPRR